MATATKQLETIYREITRQFDGNRLITVAPLDGDPPEKYEITYHIKGIYKDDSGEIQNRDAHVITISIPFGFPHFPPSCKPKTPIFHPDFDPAAICIGDFWEKDRTIGDLIVHIGQMISGHSFSTSNAFNEEAVRWYKDHGSQLPFDHLESSSPEPADRLTLEGDTSDDVTMLLDEQEPQDDFSFDQVDEGEDLSLLSREDQPPLQPSATEPDTKETGIDTLDDTFLQTDFDFFGSQKQEPGPDELVPPEGGQPGFEHAPAVDIDRFKLLAKQRRFFELDSQLGTISGEQAFDEKGKLAEQAAKALQQARDLYNQGSDYEHQGDPGRACDIFKKVEKLVSDYPGLPEDIERTSQARELLGDWTEPPSESLVDGSEAATEEYHEVDFDDAGAEAPQKGDTRTFFEETARHSSKLIPYAIGLVVVIGVGLAATSFYLNSARLKNARRMLDDCQTILKQNRFADAERQCEKAKTIAHQIQVFRGGARDDVLQEIDQILNSEVLHQGLAGNLAYEGRYLPKQVVKAMRAFHAFSQEGDTFFANKDWQQAVANYDQAVKIAEQEQGIDRELVFAVTEKQKQARFNVLLRSSDEYIKLGKWVLATDDLKQALAFAKDLTIENKAEIIASLTGKLDAIAVSTSREQGDIAFDAEQWGKALQHYKDAYTVAQETTQPNDASLVELRQLIAKAELYETINTGKSAFVNADWDTAITRYERAIAILESNSDLLKQGNIADNKKKLARTMLQAEIIRDKQEAARRLKEKNFKNAIERLNQIIATINRSEFSQDQEFAAIMAETKQAVQQAETDMLLADKVGYLEEHFKELFTKHYTASPAEALIDPKVFYEKRLGDQLLFRLECTEVGRGRPLKLVMKYTHNLNTGAWQFYSGN